MTNQSLRGTAINWVVVERTRNGEDGPRSIRCVVRVAGKRLTVPTGVSVEREYWNHELRKIRAGCPNFRERNNRIAVVRDALERAYQSVHEASNGRPTVENVRACFRALVDDGLINTLTRYLSYKKDRGDCVKKTASLLRHIERVITTDDLRAMSVASMGDDFLSLLIDHFSVSGMMESTIDSYLRQLRACLRWAERRGVGTSPLIAAIYDLKLEKRPRYSPYLTRDEVVRLLEYRSEDSERERMAKVYARIQIETGIRWGDLRRLIKGEIDVRQDETAALMLNLYTKKSKKQAMITHLPHDLPQLVEDARYGVRLSNSEYNQLLKQIAFTAGMDRLVISNDGTESSAAFELLSSRDLKRTFVLLHLLNGCPVDVVCAMTSNSLRTIAAYMPPSEHAVRQYRAAHAGRSLWATDRTETIS